MAGSQATNKFMAKVLTRVTTLTNAMTDFGYGFTILTLSCIQVQWDGNGFIEIHVPNSFMGKVCGLCGNFNGDSKDDFMLRNGRRAISAQEFGEGWSLGRRTPGCEKLPSEPRDSIMSKCFNRLRVYWRAHKRCWPIKKQFANCHKKVKPHAYYASCISDVCQCSGRRCECEALMAYARVCRREGVTINWGRRNTCGKLSKLTLLIKSICNLLSSLLVFSRF